MKAFHKQDFNFLIHLLKFVQHLLVHYEQLADSLKPLELEIYITFKFIMPITLLVN